MNSRIFKILVPVATVAVLVVNYLATTGAINGRDPKFVSDAYPTGITPAGYAFTIWSIIYLGMIGFSVFQLLPSRDPEPKLGKVRLFYLLLSAANIGWIFSWHYDLIPLSMVMMIILLFSLLMINLELKSVGTTRSKLLARIPFSIYFGWVTVATLLNAAILLVYLGVSVAPGTASIAGALVIAFVTLIGSILRFKLKSMAYPITIAWGITAIAVKQSGDTIVVSTCAFAMMTLLFFAFWGYVKDR